MNLKLASGGLLSAALLVGCSGSPKLSLPSGQWDDMNLPQSVSYSRSSTGAAAVTTTAPSIPPVVNQVAPTTSKSVAVVSVPTTSTALTVTDKANPKATVATTKVFPTAPAPAPTIVNVLAAPLSPSKALDPPFPIVAGLALSRNEVVQVSKSIEHSSAPAIKPVTIPKPVLERWEIAASDGTLRRALGKWAVRSGWQLVWDASVDVPVTANATFIGNFNTAVTQLFQSLSAADVNLSAVLYSGNRVLRVTESGRRAQ